MTKPGRYIGGHTVLRDPAYAGRLARKLRKTEQTNKRRARAKERFAAEVAAYEARQSLLIKPDSK